jgi:EAL domain-containing protein (putative c-di-GMP-specific phosphodiesterase class I)/GGDEF domain-containing protein/DNA-binding NarL/FixJ family response regulator
MSPQPHTATLLVVTSKANEAERLITSLRNGGLSVRGHVSARADRLGELVEHLSCDLIVCCAYDSDVDLSAVLAHHRELEDDVPLIVIADRQSEPRTTIQALRSGARDVTERDDAEHLQLVVGRELEDLHQRREARRLAQCLQQCEQRGRELMESSGEAEALVQQGMHVHANAAYLGIFRYTNQDDLQASPVLDLFEPDQRQSVRDFLREREFSDGQGPGEREATCVRADSSRFRARIHVAKTEVDGETCLRLIVRDAERNPVLAGVGSLTSNAEGLPDYDSLVTAIQTRIGDSKRTERPFAVILVRVRGVANLLRELGLNRGLGIVGALSAPLREIGGEDSVLARVGVDGFALLADGADEAEATRLAERIRAEVRLLRAHGETRIDPDCDVGFAVAADRCPEAVDLLDSAYRDCLENGNGAKASRGMQKPTSLAARVKQEEEEGDTDQSSKVEQALEADRLMLVYQPIVSLMGDNQENYSVLVRLLDSEENLLEAKEFIGPAIRAGLIERVDRWSIRQAIRAMSEHRRSGAKFNFFLNLAEDTFRDPGVIIFICDCLREFDVRGSWLTFVFQEELVESNLGSLTRLVEGLKKIKCRVAVNRFGATGRSPMLLQALPLDFVLLLPDYASELADDKDKQQKLLELAGLAREFNVKTVVTGIEDARTLTILWTAGVDYVQGNFLQRPSPTLQISA